MSSGELGLLLVAVASLLILARLWRTSEARANRLEADRDALSADTAKLTTNLAKQTQAKKRQAEELSTLRNKADKIKRRQSKGAEAPLGTAARIRDHEAQLERTERDRDLARSERDELTDELARLEARLHASERALAEASAAPPPVLEAAATSPLEQAETQLADLREQLARGGAELSTARQTEARMRKRMNNQEQLYASLRAELDVKKDRLRTQEEQLQRLQALKVAVID